MPRHTRYLVKWEGYDESFNTWESADNLADTLALENYLGLVPRPRGRAPHSHDGRQKLWDPSDGRWGAAPTAAPPTSSPPAAAAPPATGTAAAQDASRERCVTTHDVSSALSATGPSAAPPPITTHDDATDPSDADPAVGSKRKREEGGQATETPFYDLNDSDDEACDAVTTTMFDLNDSDDD